MATLLLGGSVSGASMGASADIKAYKKKLPRAIRQALEKTFEYWLKKHAPTHFKRSAFNKYDEYQNNYKRHFRKGQQYSYKKVGGKREFARLGWRIDKGFDTEMPLVKTGALKRSLLKGAYKFTGNNYNLNVAWTSLPGYAYKYKPGQTKKYKALVDVNDDEVGTLADVFEKFLEVELGKIDKISKKSFGKAVF